MSFALIIESPVFANAPSNSKNEKIATVDAVVSEKKSSVNQTSAPSKDKSEKKSTASIEVNLYESPVLKSKIIQHLPINTDLITIYSKGDWIKVGNRSNGETGWINKNQFQQAKQMLYQNYLHTNFTSVFFNWTKDKNGKAVIEGYRNGKKLSDADAQKLYDQMQAQEQHQWEVMQRFSHMIDQQFQNNFFNMPIMMPGVVIIERTIKSSEKTDKQKNK